MDPLHSDPVLHYFIRTTAFLKAVLSFFQYLGDEMEELHGRTIHDEDKIVKMPLLPLPGVTLVPGQIIPLRIFNPQVSEFIFAQTLHPI